MAAPPNEADECRLRLINAASRPRELTGAVDLLSHYGMREIYETFSQKAAPLLIGEPSYLKNVIGDMEIRRGDGMELGQLLGPDSEYSSLHIHHFDLDVLHQAFSLRESGSIVLLPEVYRGVPMSSGKMKEETKDKDRKHKKHKDHHKEKEHHKDRDKEKEKEQNKNRDKDRSKKYENGEDHSKKHHKKKRKHDGEDEEVEAHKHKKKKHKYSSKL